MPWKAEEMCKKAHFGPFSLKKANKKVAIIGTNGVFIGGKKYDSEMTTPDPIELQKYFSNFL